MESRVSSPAPAAAAEAEPEWRSWHAAPRDDLERQESLETGARAARDGRWEEPAGSLILSGLLSRPGASRAGASSLRSPSSSLPPALHHGPIHRPALLLLLESLQLQFSFLVLSMR